MSGRVGEGRQAAEEGRWAVTSDRVGILLRIYTTIPTSRSSLPGPVHAKWCPEYFVMVRL